MAKKGGRQQKNCSSGDLALVSKNIVYRYGKVLTNVVNLFHKALWKLFSKTRR